ncbi:U6 snRNA phosphodiesterase Usb1 [Paraphoma chrysanthemicola]|nr:U6 snRNA phosphodiesterase Usb1 [Paraphoma chrysanthemicola]
MPLVEYPDSESDEAGQSDAKTAQPEQAALKGVVKRRRSQSAQTDLPPLPSAFFNYYSTNARVGTSDNPSLHGGRKRTIPHVEGMWPSHVYLEWIPSQAEFNSLHKLIQHVRDAINQNNNTRSKKLVVPKIVPSLESELGAPLPLHVSLSRTLQIQTEDRDHFLDTLKSSLRKAAVSAFPITFAGLKWVPNFQRNRWFLVLGIERSAPNELNRLLDACNETAKRCGHPSLYIGGPGDGPMESETEDEARKRRKTEVPEAIDRSDRFHVSIAWNLEEPDEDWISLVKAIKVDECIGLPEAAFDAVKAKVGNAVHDINLNTRNATLVVAKGTN